MSSVRCARRRERHRRAVEVRRRVAAALTFVAVVTRWATAMHDSQVRDAVGHNNPAELLADHVACQFTPTGKVHWRQEFTIRHLLKSFARSAYTDKRFDFVIVRLEILVTEWPIFAVAVTTRRFELVVAISVAFARPAECFAPTWRPRTHMNGLSRGKV